LPSLLKCRVVFASPAVASVAEGLGSEALAVELEALGLLTVAALWLVSSRLPRSVGREGCHSGLGNSERLCRASRFDLPKVNACLAILQAGGEEALAIDAVVLE